MNHSSFGNPQSQKGIAHIILLVVAALGVVAFIFISSNLPLRDRLFNMLYPKKASDAATVTLNQCRGQLNLRLSANKTSPTDNLSVPLTTSKYYVHVTQKSDGKPCSASFEATGKACNAAGVCNNYNHKQWGAYRSGNDGIARIDLLNLTDPATFTMSVRPQGATASYSNQVTLKLSGTNSVQSTAANIDMTEYYSMVPGYTWVYESVNATLNGIRGNTRTQIEEKTRLCSDTSVYYDVLPWRVTKSNNESYWNYAVPEITYNSGIDLRWMVVDPAYKLRAFPEFDNYLWAYGDKRYVRSNIRDINLGAKFGNGYSYGSISPINPNYYLAPKFSSGSEIKGAENNGINDGKVEDCNPPVRTGKGKGMWILRTENDHIKIDNPGFKYDGPVLRLDFFEGGSGSVTTAPFHRETWYLAKGIGVVKIIDKHFNGYGYPDSRIDTWAPKCESDPDCLNDTMKNPWMETTLTGYYRNPKMDIQVGTDNKDFKNEITLKSTGNHILANQTKYNGYLEASVNGGEPFKWIWMDRNGDGVFGRESLNDLKAGRNTLKVRVWVPDEKVDDEVRIGDTNTPWSNDVIVNIPADNNKPKGYVVYPGGNSTTCSTIVGWSCDQDGKSKALQVDLWDYTGTPKYLGAVTANDKIFDGPELQTACGHLGTTNNHGFRFTIPSSLKDNTEHKIRAYGINIDSSGIRLTTGHTQLTALPANSSNEVIIKCSP